MWIFHISNIQQTGAFIEHKDLHLVENLFVLYMGLKTCIYFKRIVDITYLSFIILSCLVVSVILPSSNSCKNTLYLLPTFMLCGRNNSFTFKSPLN